MADTPRSGDPPDGAEGGARTPGTRISVQTADFDAAAELEQTRAAVGGQVGAVVAFIGLVREQFDAQPVAELYLEHYPGMTEAGMAAMVRQAEARWQLLDVCIVHRVGALAPTDQIVLVQVASAHRPDAFAACEFLMDYLKTDAVLWKRERGAAGTRWLSATVDDAQRRERWDDPPEG